jgi:hypothetical protein
MAKTARGVKITERRDPPMPDSDLLSFKSFPEKLDDLRAALNKYFATIPEESSLLRCSKLAGRSKLW